MEKNKNLGILFIVLSAFSFAWMSTFVRLAGDLPSVEKSFFRNLVAVGVAAFTMIRSKEKIVMGKGNLKFLILRALFGTIGILGNFYAIDHLVLSDANMLNRLSRMQTSLRLLPVFAEGSRQERLTAWCVSWDSASVAGHLSSFSFPRFLALQHYRS